MAIITRVRRYIVWFFTSISLNSNVEHLFTCFLAILVFFRQMSFWIIGLIFDSVVCFFDNELHELLVYFRTMRCSDQGSIASCFLVHLPALPTVAATSRVLISHWQRGGMCLAHSWMAGGLGPSLYLQPLFPHFHLQSGKVHVHVNMKCACLLTHF